MKKLVCLLLPFFLLLSCSVDVVNIINRKIVFPEVVSSSPANEESEVSLKPGIIIEFSQEMNIDSLRQNVVLQRGASSESIPLLISSVVSDKVSFIPLKYLTNNTIYILKINKEAKSSDDIGFLKDWTVFFKTTDIDTQPPEILEIFPENESIDDKYVSKDQSFIIYFSEEMDKISVESSFSFIDSYHNVAITGEFSWSGSNMIWKPSVSLDSFRNYTLYIGSGSKDLAGNQLLKTEQKVYKIFGEYIVKGELGISSKEFIIYPKDVDCFRFDGKDYLYVLDSGKDRVVRFIKNEVSGNDFSKYSYLYDIEFGERATTFTEGSFWGPSGMTIDRYGNIYVIDGHLCVQKFDKDGNFLSVYPKDNEFEFDTPEKIATDSSGSIYVCDSGYNCIIKMDEDGNFVKSWGKSGTGAGEFDYPAGIAVDQYDYVYVADLGNDRIQIFDQNGNFIESWGGYGSGNGEFYRPSDVFIDSADMIYVTEYGNARIQQFDFYGNFIREYKNITEGDPAIIKAPSGICVNGDNTIFVSDIMLDAVKIFDENFIWKMNKGSLIQSSQIGVVLGIDLDSNENIYVLDSGIERRILKFNKAGELLGKFIIDYYGSYISLAISRSDAVYVCETYEKKIKKYDSAGNFLLEWGGEGSGDTEFQYPFNLTIDSDENVYIIDDGNNSIRKYDRNGLFLDKWATDDKLGKYNGGISYNPINNYIYIAVTDQNVINVYDTNGNFKFTFGNDETNRQFFNSPYTTYCDDNGYVYVTDNNGIQKFDRYGTYFAGWSNKNAVSEAASGAIFMCADKNENIYHYDPIDNRVLILGIVNY